jgi:putative ABC transport system permease protein
VRVRLRQQRLLDLLAQSTLSQNHWAIKLGISRGHWSEIVNGKHPFPSPKTRERLLEVFGMAFDELFEVESGPQGGADANFQAAIADRYLIEKELGQGGMGTVYLARDVKHGRLVAIKVVAPEAVSGIGTDQFLKEIRYTARLEHHHILPLYDSGEAAGYPFYVMPYIRDGSLRDRLIRDRQLTIGETLTITRGVAAALHHAHERQLLHCDVKPENILLSENHPYVADFGISRAIHREVFEWGRRREIDSSAGTPAYVSPEQATGEDQLDARSDVYSLGCMVFEMLSGEPPFSGRTTMEVVSKRFREVVPDLRDRVPHIPPAVALVVAGAMGVDPAERTTSVAQLAADLERSAVRSTSAGWEAAGRLTSFVRSLFRRALGLDRKTRRGALLEDVRQDLRYAGRSLIRKPGYTAAAVLTLGLGVGATTAIFSVVNSVLLRPLGYADPARLVVLGYRPADDATRATWATFDDYMTQHMSVHVSYPNFELWRETTQDLFDDVGIYDDAWTYEINVGSGTEVLPGTLVSAGLLRALGVQPALGRWFTDEDDVPEAPGTIILSHGLWQRRFGSSSGVIGRTVTVRERPFTVVGVMPRGFKFPSAAAQFWMPLAWASRGSGSTNYQVVGRVKTGMSVQQAASLLEARTVAVESHDGTTSTFGASLDALRNHFVGDARPLLLIFMGAVTAVLLIACVNVVNLMLTRATGQEHELTVRAAIGAGPRRLAQQLLTESAMVSLLGSALGLGVAFGVLDIMIALAPGTIPRQEEIGIDGGVLAFTLGVALLVGIGIGLLPAARAFRLDLASRLSEGTRGASGGVRHGRIRDGLVVTQLALALVLLVSAGVLLKSFMSLLAIETGIRPQNLLTFETSLPNSRYQTFEQRRLFYAELLRDIRGLPGVLSVASAVYLPASGWFHSTGFEVEGYAAAHDEEPQAEVKQVSPDYFSTMGIDLLEGRAFTDADDESAPAVVVINHFMARRYWGQRSAVGGRVRLGGVWHDVVGVVSDVRYRGAGMDGRHAADGPHIYLSYAAGSRARGNMAVVVRTAGNPTSLAPQIRSVSTSIDPNVALFNIRPLEDILWEAVSGPRFRTWLLGAFGLVSMALSVVGVYGVMAYAVAQRTRELGIRKALGADQGHILRYVVTRGLLISAMGIAVGVVGALGATGVLRSYLYDLGPRDPMTFVIAVVALGTASLSACLVPAIRAARVDPLIALRVE